MSVYKSVMVPAVDVKPRNTFVLTIEYSHGDADMLVTEDVTVECSVPEFNQYYAELVEVMESISDARSNGDNYQPPDRSTSGFYLPAERDHLYDNSYADMSIEKITYFDESGNKFSVTMKNG